MMSDPENRELVLGAVAYDGKVVAIWEGFKAYFESRGLPFDFVLFSNYDRQIAAQLAGEIDVGWSSPLAWLQTRRAAPERARVIAMRDSDRDRTSAIVVRSDSAIHALADLRGRMVGCGAPDSPQATLIPLLAIADAGLEPRKDFEVVPHDVLTGKHGDYIAGERAAVAAVIAGAVDAACVLDGNRAVFAHEGVAAAGALRVIAQTDHYDHCNMTVLAHTVRIAMFTELLLAMSYADPALRPLMDHEDVRAWLPGRTTGYALLERAVARGL